jgi:hypothetical protein
MELAMKNPIMHTRWLRTRREDRTVNQRFDATQTITWNVELGPKQRPWLYIFMREFQFVFELRIRVRGKSIFTKYQTQQWEPKDRKWLFNEWCFNLLENRYQKYEESIPEDPYEGYIKDWQ